MSNTVYTLLQGSERAQGSFATTGDNGETVGEWLAVIVPLTGMTGGKVQFVGSLDGTFWYPLSDEINLNGVSDAYPLRLNVLPARYVAATIREELSNGVICKVSPVA